MENLNLYLESLYLGLAMYPVLLEPGQVCRDLGVCTGIKIQQGNQILTLINFEALRIYS